MYLILMRHAIAETGSENQEKSVKVLTEVGKLKLDKVIEGLKVFLEMPFELYSSPKARAFQTAEAIQSSYVELPIHLNDDLAIGEVKNFLGNLKEDPVVFAVGHEPFLSNLVQKLTEQTIQFHRSNIAVLRIDQGDKVYLLSHFRVKDMMSITNREPFFDVVEKMKTLQARFLKNSDSETASNFIDMIYQAQALISLSVKRTESEAFQKAAECLELFEQKLHSYRVHADAKNYVMGIVETYRLNYPFDVALNEKKNEIIQFLQHPNFRYLLMELVCVANEVRRIYADEGIVRAAFDAQTKDFFKDMKLTDFSNPQEFNRLRLRLHRLFAVGSLLRLRIGKNRKRATDMLFDAIHGFENGWYENQSSEIFNSFDETVKTKVLANMQIHSMDELSSSLQQRLFVFKKWMERRS